MSHWGRAPNPKPVTLKPKSYILTPNSVKHPQTVKDLESSIRKLAYSWPIWVFCWGILLRHVCGCKQDLGADAVVSVPITISMMSHSIEQGNCTAHDMAMRYNRSAEDNCTNVLHSTMRTEVTRTICIRCVLREIYDPPQHCRGF